MKNREIVRLVSLVTTSLSLVMTVVMDVLLVHILSKWNIKYMYIIYV